MKLSKYLENRQRRKELTEALNVSSSLLYQWANNIRPVPIVRCKAIVLATKGKISFKDLRPNDWDLIWEYPNLDKEILNEKK